MTTQTSELEQLRARVAELERELEKWRQGIYACSECLADRSETHVAELERELSEASAAREALSRYLSAANQRIAKLEERVKELEREERGCRDR